MEPFHFRVRRPVLGLQTGAILASRPGHYVQQIWPTVRSLPNNFGAVLYAHCTGALRWIEPVTRCPYGPLPLARPVGQPQRPAEARAVSDLRLVR